MFQTHHTYDSIMNDQGYSAENRLPILKAVQQMIQ